MRIPLRGKYRRNNRPDVLRNGSTYRTRTGPHCCNGGCGSGRKKAYKLGKVVKK